MENLTLLNDTSPNFFKSTFSTVFALRVTCLSLAYHCHTCLNIFFYFFCGHNIILQVLIMERTMLRKMILSHFFYKGRRKWKCEWHCFLDSALDVAFSLIRHILTGSYWHFFTFSFVTCSMLVFSLYWLRP